MSTSTLLVDRDKEEDEYAAEKIVLSQTFDGTSIMSNVGGKMVKRSVMRMISEEMEKS